MYSTCLFCTKPLGTNESIETFPVGRRLAFDAARGRLWVVCRKCERWNLTPLEERWEAIEECERLYRDTRKRVSTDQIGLARVAEGLELVRIGEPLRPEFAAWRYGDQFGRRRKRAFLYGGAAAAVFGGIVVGGAVTGVLSAGLLSQTGNFVNIFVNLRPRLRLRTEDGRVLKLRNPELSQTKIWTGADGEGYVVEIGSKKNRHRFEGAEAERIAGLIVPKLNSTGGSARVVREAVEQIEARGGPEDFLRATIRNEEPAAPQPRIRPASAVRVQVVGRAPQGPIAKLPRPTKLALEMALHEEQERRALQGELAQLEAAWQQAEEVAAIADDLLVPLDSREFIERNR